MMERNVVHSVRDEGYEEEYVCCFEVVGAGCAALDEEPSDVKKDGGGFGHDHPSNDVGGSHFVGG